MGEDVLGFLLLLIYTYVMFVSIAIAIASIPTPRFFPVVCLMGFGLGAPLISLWVIRLYRVIGGEAAAQWPQFTLLLISFGWLAVSWTHACVLLIRENQKIGAQWRRGWRWRRVVR